MHGARFFILARGVPVLHQLLEAGEEDLCTEILLTYTERIFAVRVSIQQPSA